MNDPTRYVSDLTAPGAYTYRATLKADGVYADATLVQSSVHQDRRYLLETHTGRTGTNKGAMGARQQERAAQLLALATEALMQAAGAAGWTVEERDWAGRKMACYYPPAPEPASVAGDRGAAAVVAAMAGDEPSEDDWRAYDQAMCAQCRCYAAGEEQADCLAAGRPLCGPTPAFPVAPEPPARHELPLTHSLRLVPRPRSQFVRNFARLYGYAPLGLRGALRAWPYYHQRRRVPAVWCDPWKLARAHQRRRARAQERRAPAVRTRLPPMFYDRAQVA